MSSSAMIFTRETAPAAIRRGTVVMSCSTPSMRKRTRTSRAVGREVDVRCTPLDGLADDLVDELDDGRVLGALVKRYDLGAVFFFVLLLGRADDVFEAVEPRDQRGDVIRRRDRDAHLVAGHDRDVVDRQHVRRVGHRDQQGALVGERHRHRLVALGDRRRDQVGGRHVDLEDAEVEVVQAVALGQRTGETVVGRSPPGRSGSARAAVPELREVSIGVVDLPLAGEAHGRRSRRSGSAARSRGVEGRVIPDPARLGLAGQARAPRRRRLRRSRPVRLRGPPGRPPSTLEGPDLRRAEAS